jgi:N-acetylglutamate synthase-like GNAT family acetyltransferase
MCWSIREHSVTDFFIAESVTIVLAQSGFKPVVKNVIKLLSIAVKDELKVTCQLSPIPLAN